MFALKTKIQFGFTLNICLSLINVRKTNSTSKTSRKTAVFLKLCAQIKLRQLPKRYCLLSLPSPTRFLPWQIFTKSFRPFSQLLTQNLSKMLLVLALWHVCMQRLGNLTCTHQKPQTRKGFVKFCHVKKACVGGEPAKHEIHSVSYFNLSHLFT